jgi:serine/threonine protein kinase
MSDDAADREPASSCPDCGKEIPGFAPMGLCPTCLITNDAGPEGVTLPVGPLPSPATFVPPSPDELSAALPNYEVEELVGRGGMGAVYRASQTRLGRTVAIKVLPTHVATELQFAERFEREARAMASLQHPHIVGVHDFGEAVTAAGVEFLYLVMEFVDGSDLHRVIRAGPMGAAEALRIAGQVSDALQYAHDHGVVHRDIKPANVMLTREGEVKVADFGLAKLVDDALDAGGGLLTVTNVSMGTPGYVAPETLREGSRAADHRVDIYALGVMLHEMLTQQVPIGVCDPPSKRNPGLDHRLDTVVETAMRAEPDQRYQQASDLVAELSAIAKREARRSTQAPGVRVKSITAAIRIAAAVGLVVSAGGAAWWWAVRPVDTPKAASASPAPAILRPSIDLPPALAAMKERGGRLRSWSRLEEQRLSADTVDSIDDFVRAEISGSSGDFWRAWTRDDLLRGSQEDKEGRTDLADAAAGLLVTRSGNVEVARGNDGLRPLAETFPEGLAVSISQGWHNTSKATWLLVRAQDGSVHPLTPKVEAMPASWKIVSDRLGQLEDVVAADSAYSFGMVLREGGELLCWTLEREEPFSPVPDEIENVASISCGNGNFLALSGDGKLWNWDGNGEFYADVPDFAQRVVAIRTNRSSARGNAAQLEDGSWAAWGIPDGDEFEKRIAELGRAVDLSFDVEARVGRARLLWIEPVEARATEPASAEVPALDLPPPLAAMKERGGRLRAWGEIEEETLSRVDGITDLVEVGSVNSGKWVALRKTGEVISPVGEFQRKSGIQTMRIGYTSGILIDREGVATYQTQNFAPNAIPFEIPFYDIVDANCDGNSFAAFVEASGKVRFLEDPSKIQDQHAQSLADAREFLMAQGNVMRLDKAEGWIILDRDGGVSFSERNSFRRKSGLPPVVDVAVGNNLYLALDESGAVHCWGSSPTTGKQPGDLSPAVAVQAHGAIAAAQLEDGTWRGWGDNSHGVVEQINSIGPAIAVDFTERRLYWIEPTEEVNRPEP